MTRRRSSAAAWARVAHLQATAATEHRRAQEAAVEKAGIELEMAKLSRRTRVLDATGMEIDLKKAERAGLIREIWPNPASEQKGKY